MIWVCIILFCLLSELFTHHYKCCYLFQPLLKSKQECFIGSMRNKYIHQSSFHGLFLSFSGVLTCTTILNRVYLANLAFILSPSSLHFFGNIFRDVPLEYLPMKCKLGLCRNVWWNAKIYHCKSMFIASIRKLFQVSSHIQNALVYAKYKIYLYGVYVIFVNHPHTILAWSITLASYSTSIPQTNPISRGLM